MFWIRITSILLRIKVRISKMYIFLQYIITLFPVSSQKRKKIIKIKSLLIKTCSLFSYKNKSRKFHFLIHFIKDLNWQFSISWDWYYTWWSQAYTFFHHNYVNNNKNNVNLVLRCSWPWSYHIIIYATSIHWPTINSQSNENLILWFVVNLLIFYKNNCTFMVK